MYIEKNGCVYILMTYFEKYCPECSQVASINNREISVRESASVGISNECQRDKIKAGCGSTVDDK
jgi:hypothetical protein